MKLQPLEDLRAQVRAGAPLPFGIRDASGQLLLAKGHVVPDEMTLEALLQRGATVDVEETSRRGEAVAPPAENFPGRWHHLVTRAAVTLKPPVGGDTVERVQEIGALIDEMATRDGDLLLYLALRAARDPGTHYGVLHALHAAVVCTLVARRLGWDDARRESLVHAALTMNLSVVELQSRLVNSSQPLTAAQREHMDHHVADTLALLQRAGVEDERWLAIVAAHHEPPAGATDEAPDDAPDEARLLRRVDAYTARITERGDTIVASPALAVRDLHAQHARDPFALALVKTLGIYPPGCHVRLVSGEIAVVIRRGESPGSPLVACVTNKRGDALQTPIRRDTSLLQDHHVAAVVPDRDVKVRFQSPVLYR